MNLEKITIEVKLTMLKESFLKINLVIYKSINTESLRVIINIEPISKRKNNFLQLIIMKTLLLILSKLLFDRLMITDLDYYWLLFVIISKVKFKKY